MANTKTTTLQAAVTAAADMALAARPGYGQSHWVEARASLQVLMDKTAREWAALQGRTVARAEMHAQAASLVEQELTARRDALNEYRAAAEAARLAAASAATARPVRRKATLQAAASVVPARKAAPVVAFKATAAKAAPARKVTRPAMDLEALVAAGFARQAAEVAKKAGAVPSEVKAVRKAAKKVAKAAAKAQKAAKKEAQAAFKATAAAKAAAKTKGRKA